MKSRQSARALPTGQEELNVQLSPLNERFKRVFFYFAFTFTGYVVLFYKIRAVSKEYFTNLIFFFD